MHFLRKKNTSTAMSSGVEILGVRMWAGACEKGGICMTIWSSEHQDSLTYIDSCAALVNRLDSFVMRAVLIEVKSVNN
jgi:hypothetical protein